MIISAVNAMTMTPARAAWIFGRAAGTATRAEEALPWWFFGLVGGVATRVAADPRAGAAAGPARRRLEAAAAEDGAGGLRATLLAWADQPGPVPPRPGRRRGARLAHHRVGELGLGPVLPGLQRALRPGDAGLRQGRGQVPPPQRHRAADLRRPARADGLRHAPTCPAVSSRIQDKGYLIVNVQLPDSASLERTVEAIAAVERIALETPGVGHTMSIPGQSFVMNAISSNYGCVFVILKPFHERRGPELTGEAILAQFPRATRARSPRLTCWSSGRRRSGPGQRRRLQADGGV